MTEVTYPEPEGHAETVVTRLISVASVAELVLMLVDTVEAWGPVMNEVRVCVR